MIELPSLYPDQQEMRDAVRTAMVKYQSVILQAPPGTGKTRMSKWILGSFANRAQMKGESGKALFAVHRRGLVDNASDSFNEHPRLPHGLIMSKRKPDFTEPVQVASIDTMNAWFCEDGKYTGDTYDLVVYDETHTHVAKLRTMMGPHNAKREAHGLRPSYLLGLSATPQHKELHQVYDHIVKGPSPEWLIENGRLSPFRYFKATQGDASRLVKRGDEYTDGSVGEAMQGLTGNLVEDWIKHAKGRATVGFFPLRSHAKDAALLLQSAGVRTAYLDGDTPDDERHQMYLDLDSGRLDYITNVGVVERGTDISRIGCVQMCVFVGSIVRWLQMIGRGSRKHPDVPDCLVLDHGDGVAKNWFFEDEVNWTLEWGDRPSKEHQAAPSIQCPKCGLSYRGGKCRCGYEPTKKERKGQGLDFVGGELVEIKRNSKATATKKKSNERMMKDALYIAGRTGKSFGSAWSIAQGMARKQGTEFITPAFVTVSGTKYKIMPYGSGNTKRKVKLFYGFTVGNHSKQANPYRIDD